MANVSETKLRQIKDELIDRATYVQRAKGLPVDTRKVESIVLPAMDKAVKKAETVKPDVVKPAGPLQRETYREDAEGTTHMIAGQGQQYKLGLNKDGIATLLASEREKVKRRCLQTNSIMWITEGYPYLQWPWVLLQMPEKQRVAAAFKLWVRALREHPELGPQFRLVVRNNRGQDREKKIRQFVALTLQLLKDTWMGKWIGPMVKPL